MAEVEKVTPEGVLEITQNYLQQLSAKELLEQFLDISHRFSSRLNDMSFDELKKLQAYLRLIGAELKARGV
ncbi:MAG: hypothetical protein JNK79_09180 [Chitinophagaceae bacterium]|nr:hypothetical protein [Chitinophagaceae bacterium]